ncbi:MAG: hypothetical protein ACRDT0_26845, partial [Pseudonocardiaceae bacterium]
MTYEPRRPATFQQLECTAPQRAQLDKHGVDRPVGVGRDDPDEVRAELLQGVRTDVGLLGELPETGRLGGGHRHLPLHRQIFPRLGADQWGVGYLDGSDLAPGHGIRRAEQPLRALAEHLLQNPAGRRTRKDIDIARQP